MLHIFLTAWKKNSIIIFYNIHNYIYRLLRRYYLLTRLSSISMYIKTKKSNLPSRKSDSFLKQIVI